MRYNIVESKLFAIFKSLMDVFIIIFGFYISFYIRYGQNIQERNIRPFFALMPYIAIVSLFFFYIYTSDNNGDNSYIDSLYSIILAIVMIQVITMAMSFFARVFAFPRTVFAISFAMQVFMMSVWEKILLVIGDKYGRVNRMLLIGDGGKNRKVVTNLMRMRNRRVEIVGEISTNEVLEKGFAKDIDSICITSSTEVSLREKILEMAVSQNKKIYLLPDLYEIILSNSKLSQFDDMPVFEVRQLSLSSEQQFFKRMLDLILVIPGIIVAAPFMVIAGIMIKGSDGGPVFYLQERLTAGGKRFELIKFRTMVVNAEEKIGPVLAGMDDPRITKPGKFLRATRLDELPQLLNVLRGDMSLVGPRPEREHFYNEYKNDIPQFKHRLSVKAGVTGLGQVLGKYTTSPEDKLAYDLLYVYNYSVLLDVKTILQTIRIMMKKSSSDGEILDDENIKQ